MNDRYESWPARCGHFDERPVTQFHCHLDNSRGSMKPINLRIAEELGVREPQVAAAILLLDGGATVP